MELLYKIALNLLPGIGPITARKLVAYLGGVKEVFSTSPTKLQKIPGIGKTIANKIIQSKALEEAEKELKIIDSQNIKVLFYLDEEYPKKLKNFDDSPIILYQKGDFSYKQKIFLAVIGTRKPDEYGKILCEKFFKELNESGLKPVIISGLAYGIDVCAHKKALEYNMETIAILGHGLGYLYPQAHKKIAKDIIDHSGALITEYPYFKKPEPSNFVHRNRIIAALADALLVVQSAKKGGSLITAEYAMDYSTPVYTFPGRISDTKMQGCNYLIKTNRAALIENANDLIFEMNWQQVNTQKQKTIFPSLNKEEQIIYDFLSQNNQPQNIDIIAYNTNMSVSKTLTTLFSMEMKGVVKSLPGRMYTITI